MDFISGPPWRWLALLEGVANIVSSHAQVSTRGPVHTSLTQLDVHDQYGVRPMPDVASMMISLKRTRYGAPQAPPLDSLFRSHSNTAP